MRIRIIFSKTEPMRYTSHLDLHRAWERVFRRADLPLLYSQGYHPQPKINLASALPLGITSEFEILDAWFAEGINIINMQEVTIKALPPGIEIGSFEQVEDNLPSLQSTLVSTIYRAKLIDEVSDLNKRIDDLMQSKRVLRERRGKKYDLRPLIESLVVEKSEENQDQVIRMQLSAREGATGRPDEVLDALSIDLTSVIIQRINLIFNNN